MNTAGIDLNLLSALDPLLEERNVTRAGRRVGLSQPAMSNVLARLRDLLDDPVLVRTSGGMEPTPRALALVGPVRAALAQLQSAMHEGERFEPAEAEGTFKIAVTDHSSVVLLPRLAARLARLAPKVDLQLVPWHGDSTLRDVETGRVDIAIWVGPVTEAPANLYRRKLMPDRFICAVREGHPRIKKRLSLEQYVATPHVLVSPRGDKHGLVDQALAAIGRQRRIAVVVPHFGAAPLLVAETDYIVTISAGVAKAFGAWLPLVFHAPPIDITGGQWFAVWHERTHRDPAHQWLRRQLVEVGESVES